MRCSGTTTISDADCGSASSLAALGGVGIGLLVSRAVDDRNLRRAWADAHIVATEDTADFGIEAMSGRVRMEPGDIMEIDVDIVLEPSSEAVERRRFTLNPGFRVHDVAVDSQPVVYRHENGLLTVDFDQPIAAGVQPRLAIHASGIPDPDFGQLDDIVDWRDEPHSSRLRLLGREASVFHRDFVAPHARRRTGFPSRGHRRPRPRNARFLHA